MGTTVPHHLAEVATIARKQGQTHRPHSFCETLGWDLEWPSSTQLINLYKSPDIVTALSGTTSHPTANVSLKPCQPVSTHHSSAALTTECGDEDKQCTW